MTDSGGPHLSEDPQMKGKLVQELYQSIPSCAGSGFNDVFIYALQEIITEL